MGLLFFVFFIQLVNDRGNKRFCHKNIKITFAEQKLQIYGSSEST